MSQCKARNGVQLIDEESGNRLDGDRWTDRGAIQDRALVMGEHLTGKEYFQINNPAKTYSFTYNDTKGKYSQKQLLLMRDAISKK